MGIAFAPIQLGYVNTADGCSYLIRRAVRMWKQGLSNDHIRAVSGYLPDNILTSLDLRNTIEDIYPSLAEAYKTAKDRGYGRAFHRDFALVTYNYPRLGIEYKGEIIGEVTKDGDLDIEDKYFFVKEHLEEVIHAKS